MTRSRTKLARDNEGSAVLRVPALEISQGERRIYSFAIDGKLIPQIATVSRVRRDDGSHLHGYQRPENLAHVGAIRRYLETDTSPMLPNAVVIAFDERVQFVATDKSQATVDYARPGHLLIPVAATEEDAQQPGFIVDGQQRCAAIREAQINRFPVCVTAFITSEPADQRAQFILVNNTKPLPKGLIHELLPATTGALPGPLMVRQLPASLLEQLNFDSDSPLYLKIQTPTNPHGVIKDNSILKMLENSLSDGVLYLYRGGGDVEPSTRLMYQIVANFWSAVAEVFVEAWDKKTPRTSRLVHGAGVIGMGFMMDEIGRRRRVGDIPTVEDFKLELKTIKDDCHWTEGEWPLDTNTVRKWNDIQNTPRDVQRLTDYLLRCYRAVTPASVARKTRSGKNTRSE